MSDKTSNLLPCPFCGGEATTFPKKFIDGRKFGIMCKETFCCIIPANFNTKEEAIKAWNNRKPMDDIVERLEKIKDIAWDEEYQTVCDVIEIVKEVGGSCD